MECRVCLKGEVVCEGDGKVKRYGECGCAYCDDCVFKCKDCQEFICHERHDKFKYCHNCERCAQCCPALKAGVCGYCAEEMDEEDLFRYLKTCVQCDTCFLICQCCDEEHGEEDEESVTFVDKCATCYARSASLTRQPSHHRCPP